MCKLQTRTNELYLCSVVFFSVYCCKCKMALSSRCLFKAFNNGCALRTLLSSQSRCVTLAPQKVQPAVVEGHDARNARYNRPQSPHLTIYRPQVTSMLSITHRMTGLALSSTYRPVSLKPRAVAPPSADGHDVRNMKLRRPQSPHLTIYQPQLTWLLSITHRGTGLALTAYVYGVGVTSLVSSKSFPQVLEALQGVDPVLIYTGKLLLAFPFAYHFVNGIRHLVWDSGRALTIKGVYTSGYIMLAASGVLTLVLCSL